MTEDEALLWMVLLHTHAVHLRPGVVADEPVILHPETQRGAAQVIADLWPNREDERAGYIFWYSLYNTRTPFEVLEAVPRDLMPQLVRLRNTLAQDPRVAAVVEED